MVKNLTKLLREPPSFINVHSLYGFDDSGEVRFHNLSVYLEKMKKLQPSAVLIGEAPGYQGTRWTGVPFASEATLVSERSTDKYKLYGPHNNYKLLRQSTPQKEPTSTIMWRTLDTLTVPPLLWAAFPHHPYQSGKAESNRPPNTKELTYGASVIKALLQEFPSVSDIIALGNVAETLLQKEGFSVTKVRHPSHGGATLFAQQLKQFFEVNPSGDNSRE